MPARPTISDLARELRLSISSVSCALNGRPGVSEKTRRRVITYAARVGYRPSLSARALSRSRAEALGIVVRDELSVIGTEPYYLRFIAGVESVLQDTSVELTIKLIDAGIDEELAIYRRWAAERRVDGVILLDEPVEDPRVPLLRELDLPAVIHGTAPTMHPGAPAVLVDDARDAATVVDHLHSQGCRHILHALGPQRHRHELRRRQCVAQRCSELGILYTTAIGPYTIEHGERAAQALVASREGRPDAMIAANDLIAVGAARRLEALGVSVPDQCRIVAWDDSVLCAVSTPTITALDRHPERYGADCASMLLSLLSAGDSPGGEDSRLLERADAGSPLIARQSTLRAAPAPAGDS